MSTKNRCSATKKARNAPNEVMVAKTSGPRVSATAARAASSGPSPAARAARAAAVRWIVKSTPSPTRVAEQPSAIATTLGRSSAYSPIPAATPHKVGSMSSATRCSPRRSPKASSSSARTTEEVKLRTTSSAMIRALSAASSGPPARCAVSPRAQGSARAAATAPWSAAVSALAWARSPAPCAPTTVTSSARRSAERVKGESGANRRLPRSVETRSTSGRCSSSGSRSTHTSASPRPNRPRRAICRSSVARIPSGERR